MLFRFGAVVFVAGIVVLICSAQSNTARAEPVDEPKKTDDKKDDKPPTFKNDIMPIITSACANCHGGRKKRGGVDLSSYDAVMKSVKANEPDKSRLVKSVIGQGAKLMPPKAGLGDEQVKIIKAWIMAGAKND
jgi:mono/diheme cytochrome c family protein